MLGSTHKSQAEAPANLNPSIAAPSNCFTIGMQSFATAPQIQHCSGSVIETLERLPRKFPVISNPHFPRSAVEVQLLIKDCFDALTILICRSLTSIHASCRTFRSGSPDTAPSATMVRLCRRTRRSSHIDLVVLSSETSQLRIQWNVVLAKTNPHPPATFAAACDTAFRSAAKSPANQYNFFLQRQKHGLIFGSTSSTK